MEWQILGAISEAVTAVCAVIGFIFVILQLKTSYTSIKADHERQKKQATIEHVREIRPLYNKSRQLIDIKYGPGTLSESNVSEMIDKNDEIRESVRELLALLEFTAVGVNTGVFDKELWYRMSATYLIKLYHRLRPYIKHVQQTNKFAYIEFEEIVLEFEDRKRQKPDPRGNIQFS